MVIFVYAGVCTPAALIRELFDLSRNFVARFFRTATPVILNESIWLLVIRHTLYIYGRIGTNAVAAVIYQALFKPGNGTLPGHEQQCVRNYIGLSNGSRRGTRTKAHLYAKRLLTLGPVFAKFSREAY